MMMFVVPPVALVALIAWVRTGCGIAAALLLAIGLAYAVALIAISTDPIFEDNGSVNGGTGLSWLWRSRAG